MTYKRVFAEQVTAGRKKKEEEVEDVVDEEQELLESTNDAIAETYDILDDYSSEIIDLLPEKISQTIYDETSFDWELVGSFPMKKAKGETLEQFKKKNFVADETFIYKEKYSTERDAPENQEEIEAGVVGQLIPIADDELKKELKKSIRKIEGRAYHVSFSDGISSTDDLLDSGVGGTANFYFNASPRSVFNMSIEIRFQQVYDREANAYKTMMFFSEGMHAYSAITKDEIEILSSGSMAGDSDDAYMDMWESMHDSYHTVIGKSGGSHKILGLFQPSVAKVSLGSAVDERYAKGGYFKLPSSNYIIIDFVDNRKKLIETFGSIPRTIPKYTKPIPEVKFNSFGDFPDYLKGTFPNVTGELKPDDYYHYTYRLANAEENKVFQKMEQLQDTESYIAALKYGHESAALKEYITATNSGYYNARFRSRTVSGKQYYLIPTELKENIHYTEQKNSLIYTDFKNDIVHYYNDGEYVTKDIRGHQPVSNRDVTARIANEEISIKVLNNGFRLQQNGLSEQEAEKMEALTEKLLEFCKRMVNGNLTEAEKSRLVLRDEDGNILKDNEGNPLVDDKIYSESIASSYRYGYSSDIRGNEIIRWSKACPTEYAEWKEFAKKLSDSVKKSYKGLYVEKGINEETSDNAWVKILTLVEDFDIEKMRRELVKEDRTRREIQADKEANCKHTPRNIPNFSDKVELLVPQAMGLATTNITNNCILDVDMGGGKTGMIIADMVNLLGKGVVKRPLLVCPDNTIAQNKKEILERFTDGKVNVFVLNTETWNMMKGSGASDAKIYETLKNLPPNTILMASYTFFSRKNIKAVDDNGKVVKLYPIAQKLISDVGVDMVTCDESHKMKNKGSDISNSMLGLSKAKIKRLATGTLIPNNPLDLFGQLRFLDPTMFGSWDEFVSKYCNASKSSGTSIVWKKGAPKQLREILVSQAGISLRRSLWRGKLPHLVEKHHFVNMSGTLRTHYRNILESIKAELSSDPKLQKAVKKAIESGEEFEDTDAGEVIIAKLQRFNQFLIAPTTDVIIQQLTELDEGALSEEDIIGPKIDTMNAIIEKHLADPEAGKVIVMMQNVEPALHCIKHMSPKYKDNAVFYRAGEVNAIEKFKNDPKCKILVAVDQSLREGHNLQVANCIIHMDLHWSPGDTEQSNARAFRTGQKKTVYVHYVVCDGSVEIPKLMRYVSKEHVNRQVTSNYNDTTEFPIIKMSQDIVDTYEYRKDVNIAFETEDGRTTSVEFNDFLERHQDIITQEEKEGEPYKEKYKNWGKNGEGKVASGSMIKGSTKIITPIISAERIQTIEEDGEFRVKRARIPQDANMFGKTINSKGQVVNKPVTDTKGNPVTPAKTGIDEDIKKAASVGIPAKFFLWREEDNVFLMTKQNKNTKGLTRAKFEVQESMYIKQVNSLAEIDTLVTKAEKAGLTMNLTYKPKDIKKQLATSNKKPMMQSVSKRFIATAAQADMEIEVGYLILDGAVMLNVWEDETEELKVLEKLGFVRIPNMMFREVTKSNIDQVITAVTKQGIVISNEDELREELLQELQVELDYDNDNEPEDIENGNSDDLVDEDDIVDEDSEDDEFEEFEDEDSSDEDDEDDEATHGEYTLIAFSKAYPLDGNDEGDKWIADLDSEMTIKKESVVLIDEDTDFPIIDEDENELDHLVCVKKGKKFIAVDWNDLTQGEEKKEKEEPKKEEPKAKKTLKDFTKHQILKSIMLWATKDEVLGKEAHSLFNEHIDEEWKAKQMREHDQSVKNLNAAYKYYFKTWNIDEDLNPAPKNSEINKMFSWAKEQGFSIDMVK